MNAPERDCDGSESCEATRHIHGCYQERPYECPQCGWIGQHAHACPLAAIEEDFNDGP